MPHPKVDDTHLLKISTTLSESKNLALTPESQLIAHSCSLPFTDNMLELPKYKNESRIQLNSL